ncbi:MAG TPA: FeoA domain-containing protein [Longimicrobiales bacterium]
MSGPSSPVRARSLAATASGEAVEIKRILFEALRELCADLGVREGDLVRCRAETPSQLLLETPTGRTVALARDWARFIQVVSPGPAALTPRRSGIEQETAAASQR